MELDQYVCILLEYGITGCKYRYEQVREIRIRSNYPYIRRLSELFHHSTVLLSPNIPFLSNLFPIYPGQASANECTSIERRSHEAHRSYEAHRRLGYYRDIQHHCLTKRTTTAGKRLELGLCWLTQNFTTPMPMTNTTPEAAGRLSIRVAQVAIPHSVPVHVTFVC